MERCEHEGGIIGVDGTIETCGRGEDILRRKKSESDFGCLRHDKRYHNHLDRAVQPAPKSHCQSRYREGERGSKGYKGRPSGS